MLTLASYAIAGATTPPVSSRWATDAVWDDGKAEVATYRASRVIYGTSRHYKAFLLTVKEDFDTRTLVKADPPYGSRSIVTVLKQNAVLQIPTPNYDYRIMTSTFVERDDSARLVKLTSGGQEWCGNTWQVLRVRNGRALHEWSSYRDGEADGSEDFEFNPGDLLEDQIPLTLRGLTFRAGLAFTERSLPSMAATHAGPVRWRSTRFTVRGPDALVLPVGRKDGWRIEAVSEGSHATWWFDAAGSHPLLKMESSDGRSLELETIERRAYWKLPPK